MRTALKQNQQLFQALDFAFGLEEFLTPWFACAFGTLVNHVTHCKAVVAGTLRAGPGEFLAYLARLEELGFEGAMLAPQFSFTDDAHFRPLFAPCQYSPIRPMYLSEIKMRIVFIACIRPKTEYPKASEVSHKKGLRLVPGNRKYGNMG